MTVNQRNILIELRAREMLHEMAMDNVRRYPNHVPCRPYRTWIEFEDQNWRTLRIASMNELRNIGKIPPIKNCEDYNLMTYRAP